MAFFQAKLNQSWRSSIFSSSYSSVCNSICFGSVRRTSLVIPTQLFASFHKFQRIVPRNGSWIFLWMWEFSKLLCVSWAALVLHGYLWTHCVASSCTTTASLWYNLDFLFILNIVVCYRHIVKSVVSLKIYSAWCSRNFRTSACFAIRVCGWNGWINCVVSPLFSK